MQLHLLRTGGDMIKGLIAAATAALACAPLADAQMQRPTNMRQAAQPSMSQQVEALSHVLVVCGISRRPSEHDQCVPLRVLNRDNPEIALDISQQVRDLAGRNPRQLNRFAERMENGGQEMGCAMVGSRPSRGDVLAVLTSVAAASDVLDADWSSSFADCVQAVPRGGSGRDADGAYLLGGAMRDVLSNSGAQSKFDESFSSAFGQCLDQNLDPQWRSRPWVTSLMDGGDNAEGAAPRQVEILEGDGKFYTYNVLEENDGQFLLEDPETGARYTLNLEDGLRPVRDPSARRVQVSDSNADYGPNSVRSRLVGPDHPSRKSTAEIMLGRGWERFLDIFFPDRDEIRLQQEAELGAGATGPHGDCLDPDLCAQVATCTGEAQAEALRDMLLEADYDGCGADVTPTPDGGFVCPRDRTSEITPEMHEAMARFVCERTQQIASGSSRSGFICTGQRVDQIANPVSNICDNPAAYCSDEQDIAITIGRNGEAIAPGGVGPIPSLMRSGY